MNKKLLKEEMRAKIRMTIAENIDTGKNIDILVEGETVQINENFLRRIFSQGVKRFRLKFIEKGQNQIFFAANQQGIEWMSFTGGRLDEKGTFGSLDEAEEFIDSKMKEGFKEVQNEAGIKEFMKKIKPALPKMIKIAAFGAIGVGVIILLSMALTPGALSILATGGMSALVRTAGGTVVDFAKDASGWIAGSFAVDATDAVSDLDAVTDGGVLNSVGLTQDGHDSLRQTAKDIIDKIHDGTATPEDYQTLQTLEKEYGVTPISTFRPATTADELAAIEQSNVEATEQRAQASRERLAQADAFVHGDSVVTDDVGLSYEGHMELKQTSSEIFNKIQAGVATPEEIQTYHTLETKYGITPNSTFVPKELYDFERVTPDESISAQQGVVAAQKHVDHLMSKVRSGTATPTDLRELQYKMSTYGAVAR